MKKILEKVKTGLKRYSLSIGVLTLALIIVSTHYVTAQQGGNNNGNSLGNHHSELTINVEPGEFTYIPLPKQNFPINFQISFSRYDAQVDSVGNTGSYGFHVVNFSVASINPQTPNSTDKIMMTRPISNIGAEGGDPNMAGFFGACMDAANFGAIPFQTFYLTGKDATNCLDGGYPTLNSIVVGPAQAVSGTPDRLMIGMPQPFRDENGDPTFEGTIPVYIQMWY